MKIGTAFPSKYLRADDLPKGKDIRVTMDYVEMENMETTGDQKPVLYFVGREKGLVLNKTNATAIEAGVDEETDNWNGKPIVIFRTTTMFGGRQVECLRVKMPPAELAGVGAEVAEDDCPF